MAEIEAQMEANGLPTKFGTASDQPTEPAADSNLAATASNSQFKTAADLKLLAVTPLEQSTLIEPVTPAPIPLVPASQPSADMADAPVTNGDHVNGTAEAAPHTNGHAEPHAPETAVDVSMSDSVVPSSVPADLSSSMTTIESSQAPAESSTQLPAMTQAAAPGQQPVSDLRTEPHSDALPPQEVAAIEERKHQEDNAADVAPIMPESSSATQQADAAASAQVTESIPAVSRSPPPAPEPSHAELPLESVEQPAQPATVLPAEQPKEPAPTPSVPSAATEDVNMPDAPASTLPTIPTTKAARGREADDDEMDDEPLAKRAKKEPSPDVSQSEFRVPDTPALNNSTSAPTAAPEHVDENDAVTLPRLAHMKKIISNLKKSSASTAFRVPVDYIALNIPNYPNVITNPMDLGTIDTRLKNNHYMSVRDFVADFDLIVSNCVTFNGAEHTVSQQAIKMQNSFVNQMNNLPPAAMVEPSKAEKKAMKLKTEPVRAIPPRRPSVTAPGSARSPKASVSASTPTYAPGPDGIPLIRRDSSIVDGRPKRAIVPPKRNSDFTGVRPKKKKYELQLKFCAEVHKEITNPKHWISNQYFTHPVDPVALNIPTYFQVIKKPMDLGTVGTKLENNQYEKAKDYEEDVRLVFKNCYKFNPEGDYVNGMGHQLEELFDSKWKHKDEWIAAREPPSDPPSEVEEDEDDDEGSDEAEVDSEDDRIDKIKELQARIEAMTKEVGELAQPKKKKKPSPPATKKSSKAKTKKEKAASTFPNLVKPQDKKKKSSTKAKPEKDRYVTFAEKQYISNGIGMLPERQMQEALRIIQQSVPSLANSDGEIELDIEEVPNHALLKLLSFVKRYAGPPPDELDHKDQNLPSAAAAPTKSKKSKPLSKQEQEAQIAELKGKLGAYDGPASPDAAQSGDGNDSSDDSADSEESEEE